MWEKRALWLSVTAPGASNTQGGEIPISPDPSASSLCLKLPPSLKPRAVNQNSLLKQSGSQHSNLPRGKNSTLLFLRKILQQSRAEGTKFPPSPQLNFPQKDKESPPALPLFPVLQQQPGSLPSAQEGISSMSRYRMRGENSVHPLAVCVQPQPWIAAPLQARSHCCYPGISLSASSSTASLTRYEELELGKSHLSQGHHPSPLSTR